MPGNGSPELVCAHTVRSRSGRIVSYKTSTFLDSTRRNNLERWREHHRSRTKAETVRLFRSCSTTAATSSSRVGSREVAHRRSGPSAPWPTSNEQCLLILGRFPRVRGKSVWQRRGKKTQAGDHDHQHIKHGVAWRRLRYRARHFPRADMAEARG